MNTKRFIGLAAAAALTFTIVGCNSSNANTNSSSNDEKITLQYYTWTDEEDYMKKIVEAFNAQNSSIEVKLNTISNDANEYNTKMMTNLTGGTQVDIYSINGTASLGLYSSKHQLVDLGESIKAANLDVGAYGPSYQDIIEVLTDGTYYALPYRTSQYALFYNKKLFDEANIPYPEQMTWNEYAELAKQLTKGEGADKQWGGYYADWMIAPLGALQTGTTILDDDLSEVGKWMDYVSKLFYEDQSHMSYKQMKAESIDWIKQFESGNIAMLVNGEWTINMLKGDIASGKTDIEFDMAPLPLPEGVSDQITVGGVSTFVGINPKSKNTDAAFEFVQFLAGEQGGNTIAESSVLPAYSSDSTKAAFLKATEISGSGYFFEANTVVENQPIAQIDEINRVYSEELDLFQFQEQDSATAISNFAKQRDSLLK